MGPWSTPGPHYIAKSGSRARNSDKPKPSLTCGKALTDRGFVFTLIGSYNAGVGGSNPSPLTKRSRRSRRSRPRILSPVVGAVLIAWFAILFTGRYPRGLFDFIEGVIRWHDQVTGYAVLLVTDRCPPFRLAP